MTQAHFQYADDESARLDVTSDDGDLTLVVGPFGPQLTVPSEGIEDEDISTERAADILNNVSGHVDPDALETAFGLLDGED